MATKKISQLTTASSIAAPDDIAVVQGGVTKQANASLITGAFTVDQVPGQITESQLPDSTAFSDVGDTGHNPFG